MGPKTLQSRLGEAQSWKVPIWRSFGYPGSRMTPWMATLQSGHSWNKRFGFWAGVCRCGHRFTVRDLKPKVQRWGGPSWLYFYSPQAPKVDQEAELRQYSGMFKCDQSFAQQQGWGGWVFPSWQHTTQHTPIKTVVRSPTCLWFWMMQVFILETKKTCLYFGGHHWHTGVCTTHPETALTWHLGLHVYQVIAMQCEWATRVCEFLVPFILISTLQQYVLSFGRTRVESACPPIWNQLSHLVEPELCLPAHPSGISYLTW